MKIILQKFGSTLVSRESGKEAWLAFQPSLKEITEKEEIEIDFDGVDVLTPSWADEFITPLEERYKDKITLSNTDNSSVKATLELLEKLKSLKSK